MLGSYSILWEAESLQCCNTANIPLAGALAPTVHDLHAIDRPGARLEPNKARWGSLGNLAHRQQTDSWSNWLSQKSTTLS